MSAARNAPMRRSLALRRSLAPIGLVLAGCAPAGDAQATGGAGQDDARATATGERWACEADLTLLGLAANDHQGFALGSLGPDGAADWNGDGAPDLLIGAYQKLDVPKPGDKPAGSVTLALSPLAWDVASPGPRDQTTVRIVGDLGSRLGRSVAWIGDLDGDGKSDFCAGDIRGPANDGSWTQGGVMHVFLSGDARTGFAGTTKSAQVRAAEASVIVEGEAPGHRFGHALAGVGDVDGDGTPDVLVGAPGCLATEDFAGRAYVLSGARLVEAAKSRRGDVAELAIWTRDGEEALDAFGYSVAHVGRGAYAVGAPELTFDPAQGLAPERSLRTNGPGYVVLRDGEDAHVVRGGAEGELFGYAVGAADPNGDGASDLLVGAPGWSGDVGERAGRVIAIARADRGLVCELHGEARFQMLGWCVGGYGGDRWAVGEFGYARPPSATTPCADAIHDRPVPQAGRMRVFGGADVATPLFTVVGERNADSAGSVFGYLGDLDGSGKVDVVFSVFRWDEPAPRNDVGKVCVFRDPF